MPSGGNNFDDINLNDDAPQLDLDFGSTEKKDSSFGFGGWGGAGTSTGASTWATGNTWSFGNETASTEIADSFSKATTTDATDTGAWSFGGNKKNKKKTTATNGFDFGDFRALDEEQGDVAKAEETNDGVGDDWGATFTTAGKKGKKDKKKGIFGDTSNEPDPSSIGTAITEPKLETDDSWGTGWGATATKTKKKGKKGEEEAPLPPPPAPTAPMETTATEDWGVFGTKKDKKKGKKITEIEEPAATVVPEAEPEPEPDTGWGSFGKKDKKKAGKKEPEKVEEPVIAAFQDPEPELDFGWGTAKKNKKGKKDDKVEDPVATTIPDPEPEAETGWGLFGKKKGSKKDTDKVEETIVTKESDPDPKADDWSFGAKKDKKKKSIWDEPEQEETPTVPETFEPDSTADTSWGVFGTRKDKGKKGKKGLLEELPPAPPVPEPVIEQKPSLLRTGSKKEKKGKKGLLSEVNEDPVTAVDSKAVTDATASVAADDDWMSGWGGSEKKDKKSKQNSLTSSKGGDAPPPPPPVPAVPDTSFDIWGSPPKKEKDKKGKKGRNTEPEAEPDIVVVGDLVETKEDSEAEWAASTYGLSAKEKEKKEKERDKAKKEKEEEERKREEENAAKEAEEAEEAEWLASIRSLPPKKRKEKEKERDKAKKEKEEREKQEKEEEGRKREEENAAKEAEEAEEAEWLASIRSLPPKKRKEKEKEREKAKKEKEKAENEKQEKEEAMRKEEEEKAAKEKEKEEEEIAAKEKEKDTVKGKVGKKGKITAATEASKAKDLLADSVPDIDPAVEGDTWGSWGTTKKDKKGGKKDMEFDPPPPPPAPTPPAQGLTPEPEEEDLGWGSFAPVLATKGKKDAKRDARADDSKANKKGAADKVEDVTGPFKATKEDPKKKASAKEETPAKAARSFWGGMAASSLDKTKTGKADEKATEDVDNEAEVLGDAELDPDEIIGIIEEPTKKSVKGKTGAKLSKTTTRESDKASKSSNAKKGLMDDDDAPWAKSMDGGSRGFANDDDGDDGKEDTFVSSLWGSSKKTSGKKGDEAKNKIGKEDSANQKASVKKGAWNEPEATPVDDQPSAAQPLKATKAAMNSSKTSKQSSVLQRVKELEKNKAPASASASAPEPEPEPIPPPPWAADPEPPSKLNKKGTLNKSKDLSSSKPASSKKKALSPEPVHSLIDFQDSVPGSFPGELEGMDDDFGDLLDPSPLEEKEIKESKKSSKSTKEPKFSAKKAEVPEPQQPPTPPPEAKKEKPIKKERARVVKAGGASSWGMWGAAAPVKDKKDAKSKDDADTSPPAKKEKAVAPGLSRSKSVKTAKENDKETIKSDPKSSDSDKPKKVESRPPKSRGSSFGGFFGGPPTRTKSVRRNSTATSGPKVGSRRQSIDIDATGLPSPPPEDGLDVDGKAAKLMGVSRGKLDRKASTKTKQKVSGKRHFHARFETLSIADSHIIAAPDPYAIDSDDMVMVNGLDDPIINAPIPKKSKDQNPKSKSRTLDPDTVPLKNDLPDRTRSKRGSKLESGKSQKPSKLFNEDDDIVMVDAGPSDSPEIAEGPDDMQFITRPKGLQRSSTSSKKPESKIGGLFGAFRKKPASDSKERSKSKNIAVDEVAPRKRTVTGGDDSAKRPRRDDRKHSEKVTSRAAEGYVYNTAPEAAGAAEAEEADARKEERRVRRAGKERGAKEASDEALKFEAERRAKRKVAGKDKIKDEKEKQTRKAEEAEARAQEERDARRAARRAKEEEQANLDLEEDILKPQSKRRDAGNNPDRSSRPSQSDRRRSHYDKPMASQTPDEEEARRVRRDERRAKADRRKSTAPVDDYFDPRNGKRRANQDNDPYGGGGNDHTASWVESLAKESPEPPPLEPTIMEPAPDLRADDLVADGDLRRSSTRKSKRSSRMYADPATVDDPDGRRQNRRQSKREGVRSGEASADEGRIRSPRRQSDLGGVKLGAGAKTFDGKTGQGKRSSWFQKIGGRI